LKALSLQGLQYMKEDPEGRQVQWDRQHQQGQQGQRDRQDQEDQGDRPFLEH
jgi:hypothetical protein